MSNLVLRTLRIILFFLYSNSLFAQTIINEKKQDIKSLQKMSYKKLENFFLGAAGMGFEKKEKYAKAYLLKAKKENNTVEIADGYFMMLYATKEDNTQIYIDSIIAITKGNINYNQPAKAYLLRANIYGTKGLYKEAFTALDEAYYCAISSGNIVQLYDVKYYISRLKTDIGDYESSLNILKDVISYYKNQGNVRAHIVTSWALGNSFNLLKKPDSAITINKQIIPLSLKTRDSVIYYKLLLSSAISYYQKENYKSSLDSILKLRKVYKKRNLNNSTNVLINLFQGKIYLKQNKAELAIKNFEKVDSISTSKNYFHFSIRENYTLMYNFYKEKNDIKNQLHYINKLLVTDSILDNDFAYLVKNVNNKYTTPSLILEKQKIIKSLTLRTTNLNLRYL